MDPDRRLIERRDERERCTSESAVHDGAELRVLGGDVEERNVVGAEEELVLVGPVLSDVVELEEVELGEGGECLGLGEGDGETGDVQVETVGQEMREVGVGGRSKVFVALLGNHEWRREEKTERWEVQKETWKETGKGTEKESEPRKPS